MVKKKILVEKKNLERQDNGGWWWRFLPFPVETYTKMYQVCK